VKYNTRGWTRLGYELSNPGGDLTILSDVPASPLKGLQHVVDAAMQESLSKKGEESCVLQASSFLPIFQSKSGRFGESLLSTSQDSQPLSFSPPTDALANKTIVQKWNKQLGVPDTRIFKTIEVTLRGYPGMQNQDALLCQALAILHVFPPTSRSWSG
jgi:hypothetical protein